MRTDGLSRSFLRGRNMGDAVTEATKETLQLLADHRLLNAYHAVHTSNYTAWNEWMAMRGAMLAGGFHRVRLRGGRGIDR